MNECLSLGKNGKLRNISYRKCCSKNAVRRSEFESLIGMHNSRSNGDNDNNDEDGGSGSNSRL